MLRVFMLALALTLPSHASAFDLSGTITILEGSALVYRGTGRVHAVPGLRLTRGDIIETAASTFVQIELVDRSAVQLGPATRMMITAPGSRQKTERSLYVLDGWVKMDGSKRDAAAGPGFDMRTPLVELPANSGVVVMRHSPSDLGLFVERGDARLGERQANGSVVVVPLKVNDFYVKRQGAHGAMSSGATRAFIAEVPRDFRDSLPPMLEKFADRLVQPPEASEFVYADVEHWLKAESPVRRSVMPRWRWKVREPAFRSALIANLSAHPEWDPILFPEKYLPKPPPVPRAAVAVSKASSSSAAASAVN
jgi:hypothetical protein